MIGKGATPSFFAIANDNYTLTQIHFQSAVNAERIVNNKALSFSIFKA